MLKRKRNAIIQHEENWLGWIVIEQEITSNTIFCLHFQKEIALAHFQSIFGRSNLDVFWENQRKMHEGECGKEFFP